MLSNISWTTYIVAVITVTIIYYSFLALRYYRPKLKGLFAEKQRISFPESIHEADDVNGHGNQEKEPWLDKSQEEEFIEIESLIGRIKDYIASKEDQELTSKPFSEGLRTVLTSYPSVKNSPLRSSVNELIVTECEKRSAVTLSESAVDQLWEDAL